jgi:hypothetical protein
VPPKCLIDEQPLWFPVPAHGIDLPNPRGGTPFVRPRFPASGPRPQELSRRRLQALLRIPMIAAGPRSRRSQTPPFPEPTEILTQDRWGALGNRAIATRRTGERPKAAVYRTTAETASSRRVSFPTVQGPALIVVDPQGARPSHRTRGRQAFASCLGLAELSRGHCTPYI